MSEKPAPVLRYAEQLTYENVRDLEAFCYQQLERLHGQVGETGELSFAMGALSRYVSNSAGLLEHLLKTDPADRVDWQKAAIVREWQQLRATAHPFNHRDGFDWDRWWTHLEHHDAADEAAFRGRIAATDEEAIRP
ncbi:hypothetical protein ACN6K8_001551 [[Kitasatospora] papulosa]|uniref:hypothetical protein n=1 Tax=Streptomyces TaxID=1883 RepID=UPI000BCF71C3|nr:hypothetical protein BCL80_12412 [Streptomyces avidinii]SNX81223.1 hypothetical protein SAMN05421860_12212 [Streptomyces microflavus]